MFFERKLGVLRGARRGPPRSKRARIGRPGPATKRFALRPRVVARHESPGALPQIKARAATAAHAAVPIGGEDGRPSGPAPNVLRGDRAWLRGGASRIRRRAASNPDLRRHGGGTPREWPIATRAHGSDGR